MKVKDNIELPECEDCPLSWEEGYEYKDGGCYENEDIEWCKKSLKERQRKADKIMEEIEKHWDMEAEAIDKYYSCKFATKEVI